MNKKLKLGLASLALVGVMVVGGSLAYFTDTDTKTNVVTLGQVDGSLKEDTDEENTKVTDEGIEYLDPVTPGKELSKKPYLSLAEDSEDAYARVKITVNGVDGEGVAINPVVLNELGFDFNNAEGWHFAEDGYVYYNTKLTQENATTPYIFTTVTFPSKWGNEMANAKFEIVVKGELIQADNFTPTVVDGNITSWGDVTIEQAN